MNYLFKSRKRLGDVLLCLPGALYLSQRGHHVWIECPVSWHPIFEWVSYALPWGPGCPTPDKIFDTNDADMTRCESTLINHVNEWYPELAQAPKGQSVLFDRRPQVPDYGLPKNYVVVSPFGYSQFRTPPPEWVIEKTRRLLGTDRDLYCLTDAPRSGLSIPCLTARSVAHLPHLLEHAEEVVTINSSPNIIASAVRRSHFLIWDDDIVQGRTNYTVPHQVVVRHRPLGNTLPAGGASPGGRGVGCKDQPLRQDIPADPAWKDALRSFIRERGIRSMLEIRCDEGQAGRLDDFGDLLYYGTDFSPDVIGALRRSSGSSRHVFYATDLENPELPNYVDLAIVRDLLERMNPSNRDLLLRRLCAYRYSFFVIDAAQGVPMESIHLAEMLGPTLASRTTAVFQSERRSVFMLEHHDSPS